MIKTRQSNKIEHVSFMRVNKVLFKWKFYSFEIAESSEMIYENNEISSVNEKYNHPFHSLGETMKQQPQTKANNWTHWFPQFHGFSENLWFSTGHHSFHHSHDFGGFVIDLYIWFRSHGSIWVSKWTDFDFCWTTCIARNSRFDGNYN